MSTAQALQASFDHGQGKNDPINPAASALWKLAADSMTKTQGFEVSQPWVEQKKGIWGIGEDTLTKFYVKYQGSKAFGAGASVTVTHSAKQDNFKAYTSVDTVHVPATGTKRKQSSAQIAEHLGKFKKSFTL